MTPFLKLRWPRHLAARLSALAFLAAGVSLTLLALGAPAAAQGTPMPPLPTTRPSAVRGKELFIQNCQPCHGSLGRGDGETLRAQGQTAPSFALAAFHTARTPVDIYTIISEGRVDKLMPPWKGRLTPDQMWDLTAYSWWLGAGGRTLSRGQAVWAAECASCHGANGAQVAKADLSQGAQRVGSNQADLATRSAVVAEHAKVWPTLSVSDQAASLAYARSLSFDAPLLPTASGVIRGTVRNGTPGASIQPGQVVSATLFSFVGTTVDEPVATTVNPDGSFEFKGLVTDPDYSYGVGVRYNGVQYFSPLIKLTTDQASQTPVVTVYETTTTDPGMRIGRAHVIAEFLDPNSLRIGELFEVENPSDKTFAAPPGGTTFDLPLPPGATNVRFQDEDVDQTSLRNGETLRLTTPWTPGTRQVLIAYDLPYNGDLRLARSWPYPVSEVNVLIQDAGIQARGEGLQARPDMEAPGGGKYISLAAQTLPARQPVAVTLSGTPRQQQPGAGQAGTQAAATARVQSSYQNGLRWFGVGLLAASVLAFLVWPKLRPAVVTGRRENLAATRERLLDQLADLDDAHAAGELRDSDYMVQRADTKSRLVAIMRASRAEE